MKRLLVLAFLFMFMAGLFVGTVKIGHATPITVGRVFTSLSYDGYTYKSSADYPTVWNLTFGTAQYVTNYERIGQCCSGPSYEITRGYLYFDTSVIPDGAAITQAILSINTFFDGSDTDFNMTVQNGQPSYPHIVLQSGDYYKAWYSGDGGSRNTSEITALNYWNITLNASGMGWIDIDGTTKLCLRSSKDISGVAPTGVENINIYTVEQGETYAPKLYVTYTFEGYSYIVHGPYYESGAVANCLVNLTLQIENMATNYTFLNGTDGVADVVTYQVEQRGVVFTWNISSSGTNQTRTFYLTTDTFEELYIFIPNPDEPTYQYTFSVIDLAGIHNGYLETIITLSGTNRIVERQKTDVVNSVPFWMIWAHRYDLRLTCDKGTLTWGGFIAQSEQSQTLVVTADAFTPSYGGLNVTVAVGRRNDTWIQANYTDNLNVTSWVYVCITHKEVHAYLTDYTTNGSNPAQVNWYSASATTDYHVSVLALVNVTEETWSYSVPATQTAPNPWTGVLDILGTLPFPGVYVVGFGIVMCVLLLTSYVNMVFGCFLTVIVAAFLNWLRWLNIGWNLVGFGFAIVVLAAMREAKRTEGYETP